MTKRVKKITSIALALLVAATVLAACKNSNSPDPVPAGNDKTFTVKGVTFTMKFVAGGTFSMGAQNSNAGSANYDDDAIANEQPVHSVTLKDFWLGETEVTQELWAAVTGKTPTAGDNQWISDYGLGAKYPAYYLSWNDCKEFVTALNALTGVTFRLPTEAEWEYAARGGAGATATKYAGSNSIDAVAWYADNAVGKSHPVATKQANKLGLYDMSGNLQEWCEDDWHTSYTGAPDNGSAWISAPRVSRVVRGGSYDIFPTNCRVAYRSYYTPDYGYKDFGFRLAYRPAN